MSIRLGGSTSRWLQQFCAMNLPSGSIANLDDRMAAVAAMQLRKLLPEITTADVQEWRQGMVARAQVTIDRLLGGVSDGSVGAAQAHGGAAATTVPYSAASFRPPEEPKAVKLAKALVRYVAEVMHAYETKHPEPGVVPIKQDPERMSRLAAFVGKSIGYMKEAEYKSFTSDAGMAKGAANIIIDFRNSEKIIDDVMSTIRENRHPDATPLMRNDPLAFSEFLRDRIRNLHPRVRAEMLAADTPERFATFLGMASEDYLKSAAP